jgi:nitroreductase
MSSLAEPCVANEDFVVMAAALMESRHTILPKRLVEPGPDAAQLEKIFSAAATAPDHGRLCPWRFIVVPPSERHRLAETFASSLKQRDIKASEEEMNRAREKAYRAPLLMLMVVDSTCGDRHIDLNERLISAGCALQNMLLMTTAMGLGSAITSGKALTSVGLHALFQLSSDELALCFISIGTVLSRKPAAPRPEINAFVSMLSPSVENRTDTHTKGAISLTGLESK